jgi:hypothetical protein
VGRDLLSGEEDQGFAVMRNNEVIYFRQGDLVLVRDIRDTVSALYPVDQYSRMVDSVAVEDAGTKASMNRQLERYLQTLDYIFTNGLHRISDSKPESSRP